MYPSGYVFKPGTFKDVTNKGIILIPLGFCLAVAFIICCCSCWWKSYYDRQALAEMVAMQSRTDHDRTRTISSLDVPPSYEQAVLMPLVQLSPRNYVAMDKEQDAGHDCNLIRGQSNSV